MAGCVCGFDPPGEPNPDCERCRLVSANAALAAACETLVSAVDGKADGWALLSKAAGLAEKALALNAKGDWA